MQKLMLVSDYDGTFKSNIKNLKINIEAVNRFRENGNLFAISTARSFNSIKKECIKYNIKYDYLFCNNGLVLFDDKDNVIYKKHIDNEVLLEINSIINYNLINSVEYYNSYRKTDLILNNSIIKVRFGLNILLSYPKLYQYIESKYTDLKISNYYIYASLKKILDKCKGLEVLADKLSSVVLRENIITVGNSFNDFSMLKSFDGYRMLFSNPFLFGSDLKTTKEVHTLMRKLEK